jgi:hypothetical protein
MRYIGFMIFLRRCVSGEKRSGCRGKAPAVLPDFMPLPVCRKCFAEFEEPA